jgi:hypothetical protein
MENPHEFDNRPGLRKHREGKRESDIRVNGFCETSGKGNNGERDGVHFVGCYGFPNIHAHYRKRYSREYATTVVIS